MIHPVLLWVMMACLSAGYFCAGVAFMQRKVLYWRIKWIEMEHTLARLEGREPRDINTFEAIEADSVIPPQNSGGQLR